MKTFFRCDVKNIKQNGIEVLNALVVSQIRYGINLTKADVEYELSDKNKGIDILGKRYIVETDTFEAIDEEKTEETQLDRIEANTASLKADIEQSAIDNYTLELMESGVL